MHNQSILQSIDPSIHKPSIHQSINPQSIDLAIHRLINPQSINPVIHRSINPSIHQSTIHKSINPCNKTQSRPQAASRKPHSRSKNPMKQTVSREFQRRRRDKGRCFFVLVLLVTKTSDCFIHKCHTLVELRMCHGDLSSKTS